MQKIQPPGNHLIQPLLKHFQELLEVYMEYYGTQPNSSVVARISSNYSNIQNILQNSLKPGHPDLVNNIYCTCYLNNFSHRIGQGPISLLQQIQNILPRPYDHRLEAYFFTECLDTQALYPISNAEIPAIEALEHFKEFDDPDLKCMLSNEYWAVETNLTSHRQPL
jgi:hypothetical protein